jgi:hypothetical protein
MSIFQGHEMRKKINYELTTPILFIIFNRPDITGEVFDTIKKAKPKKLFVCADGPRKNREDDIEKCANTRNIIDQVDWECEVYCNFSEVNQGCKIAVSSAINWFFDQVEEGIILEDDCLPSQSFFWFCQELLEKYREDERIMQISGNNYLFGRKQFRASYYFSKLNDIWGWATWKRAWRHYDISMKDFPEFVTGNQLDNYLDNKAMRDWLMSYFEESYGGKSSVWSSQWSYAICKQNGLIIVPSVNLATNIGFCEGATHGTGKSWDLYKNIDISEIEEIAHPEFILPDNGADLIRFEIIRRTDPRLFIKERIKSFAKQMVRRIKR